MSSKNILTLTDAVIAQIAKVVQVAILTGTDITDNLRMMKLVDSGDGNLGLDEEYKIMFESHIEKMVAEASSSAEGSEISED